MKSFHQLLPTLALLSCCTLAMTTQLTAQDDKGKIKKIIIVTTDENGKEQTREIETDKAGNEIEVIVNDRKAVIINTDGKEVIVDGDEQPGKRRIIHHGKPGDDREVEVIIDGDDDVVERRVIRRGENGKEHEIEVIIDGDKFEKLGDELEEKFRDMKFDFDFPEDGSGKRMFEMRIVGPDGQPKEFKWDGQGQIPEDFIKDFRMECMPEIRMGEEMPEFKWANGDPRKARLGVGLRTELNETREGNKVTTETNTYIDEVYAGSPAEKAGLKKGDRIIRLDEKVIEDMAHLSKLIGDHNPGDVVTIVYTRDGSEYTTKATLEKPEEQQMAPYRIERKVISRTRDEVENPCEELTKMTEKAFFGVTLRDNKVTMVVDKSAAEEAGIKKGDILKTVAGTKIDDFDDLLDVLAEKKPGDKIKVTYERDGDKKKATATLRSKAETLKEDAEDLRQRCNEQNAAPANEDPSGDAPAQRLDLRNFKVFPNPSKGQFNVSFDSENVPTVITINNASGAEVWRAEVSQITNTYNSSIDISTMAKGVYYLNVKQGDKTRTEKIMVN